MTCENRAGVHSSLNEETEIMSRARAKLRPPATQVIKRVSLASISARRLDNDNLGVHTAASRPTRRLEPSRHEMHLGQRDGPWRRPHAACCRSGAPPAF